MSCFFCFNDTATTEIYTLSLHDALPIWRHKRRPQGPSPPSRPCGNSICVSFELVTYDSSTSLGIPNRSSLDRKSTRLNSSHANISYAVFCLKQQHLSPVFSLDISLPSLS